MSDVSYSGATLVRLDQVRRQFGEVLALDGVSADIQEGEFFSLLGPSGCGKTTLLRMIGGFDEPTTGDVYIDGEPMTGIPANRRPTNMVFQSYAIFPHLNVAQNVGYGLRRLRLQSNEEQRRIDEALAMVQLTGYGDRAAHELSGGQRQRVALARALAMRPRVLLLDEPLSALDKQLREQMQRELRELQRAVGITFILVTHDQEEALIMSDRIAVMFDGQIAQLAPPSELYRRPANRRVASFIGTMNFFDVHRIGEDANGVELDIAGLGRVQIPHSQVPAQASHDDECVGVRPEMLTLLLEDGDRAERETAGAIVDLDYYGDMTHYLVRIGDLAEPAVVSMRNAAGRRPLRPGDLVRVGWGAESVLLLT